MGGERVSRRLESGRRRSGARRAAWPALLLLLVSGCGGEERSLGDALRDLPQDTVATAQPDVIPLPEPLALDTAAPLGTAPPPDPSIRPGEPQDVLPWIPDEEPAAPPAASPDAQGAAWTAGTTRRRAAAPAARGVATLSSVRQAANPGFDRVVFEFAGGTVPGYHVEYVDRPVRECGSGRAVPMQGDGWLMVRLEPARMHTDAGTPTVSDRHRRPQLAVLRELRSTCDFEAQVEWVLAVAAPNRYRVLELSEPTRLVVDVQH
jgi:hypothetical protein